MPDSSHTPQAADDAPPVIVNPESVGNLDETPIVRVGPILARILGPATTGRDKMREGCYGCSSPAPAVCATNCADAQRTVMPTPAERPQGADA